MGFRTLTVSEVSNYISSVFEAEEMLHDVQVKGEISSFQIKNDIVYYTLKDNDSIINCITFGADKCKDLKIGDEVVATGSISYYRKGGKLNFSVYKIEPYGLGDIYKQFLLLKQRLEGEGLFDASHKKQLPSSITKIGVVTSVTGAVRHDIEDVATRRNPGINIVLYPAKVQGDGADFTIIEGIEYFENTDVDVVIVARGGGSYEDLQPFNSEALARVVYNANKVIVSAVGHETDFTIIDFVADLRAPTPSAAAELVTKDIKFTRQKLENLKGNLLYWFATLLDEKRESIFESKTDLQSAYEDKLLSCQDKLFNLSSKLKMLKTKPYENKESKLQGYLNSLSALNPANLLSKGYSKVFRDNKVIKSRKELKVNDEIIVSFADGNVNAKIID